MWTTKAILLAMIGVTATDAFCPMCPNNEAMTCPGTVLRWDGTTCQGMAVEMAELEGQMCTDYQYWGEACCTQDECMPDFPNLPDKPLYGDTFADPDPSGVASGNTVANANEFDSGNKGDHDPCHLCRDGSFPGEPYWLINMLGYGEGSCGQWYYFALNGNVVRHQCDALMCKLLSHEQSSLSCPSCQLMNAASFLLIQTLHTSRVNAVKLLPPPHLRPVPDKKTLTNMPQILKDQMSKWDIGTAEVVRRHNLEEDDAI